MNTRSIGFILFISGISWFFSFIYLRWWLPGGAAIEYSTIQWLHMVFNLLSAGLFSAVGYSYLFAKSTFRKQVFRLLAVLYFFHFLTQLTLIIQVYEVFYKSYIDYNPLIIVLVTLMTFVFFSFFMATLLLSRNNPDKIARAAIWLFAGALYWLLFQLHSLCVETFSPIEKSELLMILLEMTPSVSLIIYSFYLHKNHVADKKYFSEALDEPEYRVAESRITVMKWIACFMLASLPVLRLLLIRYWAVNKKDKAQENWAKAQSFFSLLLLLLLLSIYGLSVEGSKAFGFPWLFLVSVEPLVLFLYLNNRRSIAEEKHKSAGTTIVSFGQWLGYLCMVAVPVAGQILLLVWTRQPERRQWAVAQLYWLLIRLVWLCFIYAAWIEILHLQRLLNVG